MARLIDANALLETITKTVAENLTAAENVGRIIIAITNAPTVDAVEVVHGRWENGTCTNCGQVDFSKPNYCPNCGAKMDGERRE